jgi:hypothetical protein
MPAEFFYPISGSGTLIGTYDEWTLGAGANKNVACRPGGGRPGPMTHNDATSYLTAPSNAVNVRQELRLDWPSPIGSVSAITLGERTQHTGAGNTVRTVQFMNAAGTLGGVVASVQDSNTWETTGPSDAAAKRPGGGAWQGSDCLEAETGIYLLCFGSTAGATGYCTSVWGLLTYDPPPGGLIFMLGSLVAGAVLDFGQFMGYLTWREAFHPRRTRWAPGEAEWAWREFRAYRHPAYFLP